MLLRRRGEKSEMWLAIFCIMSCRISLLQIASGVSNSPRKVSLNFSAPAEIHSMHSSTVAMHGVMGRGFG